MGEFASGDVNMYFDKEDDALKVHELLNIDRPEEVFTRVLGEKGQGSYTFYDFCDNGTNTVEVSVSSDRVQNAEWQVDNLVKLIKKLVEDGEIEAPEFQAELLTQYTSWYMEGDEFKEEDDEQ
jgi:hypothetical protein